MADWKAQKLPLTHSMRKSWVFARAAAYFDWDGDWDDDDDRANVFDNKPGLVGSNKAGKRRFLWVCVWVLRVLLWSATASFVGVTVKKNMKIFFEKERISYDFSQKIFHGAPSRRWLFVVNGKVDTDTH